MARVKTYDCKKFKMIFGTEIITGYAAGTFINIEPQGDGTQAVVGCDQEVVRSIDPEGILANITITLLQSSSSNRALSLMKDVDNQSGAGIYPLVIKDLTGDSVFISDQAWITKKPNLQRGKTVDDGNCEWVIQAVAPDDAYLVGGHS